VRTEEQKLAARLFADYSPTLSLENIENISSLKFGSGEGSTSGFDWFPAVMLQEPHSQHFTLFAT